VLFRLLPGVNWSYTAPSGGDPGVISVFQTIDSSRTTPSKGTYGTNGATCSDTSIPYGKIASKGSTYQDRDAPAIPIGDRSKPQYQGTVSFDENFYDFFMYKSNTTSGSSDSIWVQLGHLNWGWTGSLNCKPNWQWINKPNLTEGSFVTTYGIPGHGNEAWTSAFP
jgi:hypothetical protein